MKNNPEIPHILVIEDEESIAEMIRYLLEKSGFRVSVEMDGDSGFYALEESIPDVLVVDWMLPDRSGIEIIRQARANPDLSRLPIIMLTARGEENDRLMGLDSGADDYMVKPFSPKELVARIKSLLRRTRPIFESRKLSYHGIEIDLNLHQASYQGQIAALGPTEFRLLTHLVEHPEQIFSREQLLDRVWGQDIYVEERTVDACIKRIRHALAALHPPLENYIQTRRGLGYLLSSEESI